MNDDFEIDIVEEDDWTTNSDNRTSTQPSKSKLSMFRLLVLITFLVLGTIQLLFECLNTQVGWYSTYWELSPDRFLWVCAVSLGLLIYLAFHDNKSNGRNAAMPYVVSFLILLLSIQLLPPIEQGLQFFLPLRPWSYESWSAIILSGISWSVFFFCVIGLIIGELQLAGDAHEIDGSVLIAGTIILALVAPLSFWIPTNAIQNDEVVLEPNEPTEELTKSPVIEAPVRSSLRTGMTEVESLETSLSKWDAQKKKMTSLHSELEQEKKELVAKLKSQGVQSSEDLKENTTAQVLAKELADLVKSISIVQKKVLSLESAIVQGESLMRKVKRQQKLLDAGLSEQEIQEFTELKIGIEDMLQSSDIVEDTEETLELDELLKQELGTE